MMTDERRNRIVAAVTVNVIILIAILVAVVVYQLAFINVQKNKKIDLRNRIEQLEDATQDKVDTLEHWQSEAGLEDLAYRFGFSYGK